VGAVLLALAALPGAPARCEEAPRPLLVIPEPVWDWGTAFRGERLEHIFTIENQGSAPLIISNIKPQCGCTLAEEYKKVLAPGEMTKITLTLETGAMKGEDEKKKYTEIESNAIAKEDNKLWMQGEIVDLLKLDPDKPRVEAVLGTTAPSPPGLVRLEPNRELGRKVEVLSAQSRKGLVTTSLRAAGGGPGYEISMEPRIDGTDRSAFQDDMLELAVNVDGKRTQLSYTVTIHLLERIAVNPSKSVYFAPTLTKQLKEGSLPRKVLDIESIGGPEHRFQVTAVSVDNASFKAEIATVEPGKRYQLAVTVLRGPEGGKGVLRGRVEVATDDPEVPILKIPLSATFTK
jgi:hypothetical protein